VIASREEMAAPPVRRWIWAQLLIGWLPVWALYATMILAMHGGSAFDAISIAARAIGAAALLSWPVLWLTERFPWPRPVRVAFVLLHLGGAAAFSVAWILLASAIEGLMRHRFFLIAPAGVVPFLSIGIWLYIAVAGVSYAARATERAARAEATAARSQLAALRGQLNPHFLFNALHTVVQLIPVEPARAAEAAERLAGLLRSATAEDRDLVPLAEERGFVERYLALEALRFGERLIVRTAFAAELDEAEVPSFALQTLVENAVRHGAALREAATTIVIAARAEGGTLVLEVRDDGSGVDLASANETGTGLRRLRERLAVLYGGRASLTLTSAPDHGFTATVRLPLVRSDED
jgi:signal transduction histidine kinase